MNIFQESNFFRSFDFAVEFDAEMRRAETRSRDLETRKKSSMRTFEDSAKSKKTVASMIEKKDGKDMTTKPNNNHLQQAGNKAKSVTVKEEEEEEAVVAADDDGLNEEQRMANLKALQGRKISKKGKQPRQQTTQFRNLCFVFSTSRLEGEEPQNGKGKRDDQVESIHVSG